MKSFISDCLSEFCTVMLELFLALAVCCLMALLVYGVVVVGQNFGSVAGFFATMVSAGIFTAFTNIARRL